MKRSLSEVTPELEIRKALDLALNPPLPPVVVGIISKWNPLELYLVAQKTKKLNRFLSRPGIFKTLYDKRQETPNLVSEIEELILETLKEDRPNYWHLWLASWAHVYGKGKLKVYDGESERFVTLDVIMGYGGYQFSVIGKDHTNFQAIRGQAVRFVQTRLTDDAVFRIAGEAIFGIDSFEKSFPHVQNHQLVFLRAIYAYWALQTFPTAYQRVGDRLFRKCATCNELIHCQLCSGCYSAKPRFQTADSLYFCNRNCQIDFIHRE